MRPSARATALTGAPGVERPSATVVHRSQLTVSQEEFADLCGLDRTYDGGIERGERNVSLVNLDRLAKALLSIFLLPTVYVWVARDGDKLPELEESFEDNA